MSTHDMLPPKQQHSNHNCTQLHEACTAHRKPYTIYHTPYTNAMHQWRANPEPRNCKLVMDTNLLHFLQLLVSSRVFVGFRTGEYGNGVEVVSLWMRETHASRLIMSDSIP